MTYYIRAEIDLIKVENQIIPTQQYFQKKIQMQIQIG